jgi:hypothetical protein
LKASVSSIGYKSSDPEIANMDLSEDVLVYPNPSNSTFTFKLQSESKELVNIQLFDGSGKLVKAYNSLNPDQEITIGSDLDMGLYVAVITRGNDRKIVKLSKIE